MKTPSKECGIVWNNFQAETVQLLDFVSVRRHISVCLSHLRQNTCRDYYKMSLHASPLKIN